MHTESQKIDKIMKSDALMHIAQNLHGLVNVIKRLWHDLAFCGILDIACHELVSDITILNRGMPKNIITFTTESHSGLNLA